ncbi:MAG: gamma-glutamylcyclotransferase, partial [Clostridia bacterium]|nr:gamma-glutamylcyclotransferase [Clostridia bacterium]
FPVAHKGFTHFILDRKKGLESALEEGKTKHDFDEDFRIRIEDMICKMNSEQKAWLFVYGTLMKSNSYQGYVGDYEFRGKASLTGYALYDLGQYPGIIEDKEERVEGELLCIDEDKLADIDAYEAEGCLYKRKMVKVHTQQDEPVEAFTYVYNKSLDGKRKIPFSFQPWYLGISDILDEYVWYACYGSNIKRERFMKYINQCEDNTPPRMERPRMLNHPIYFAKKSNTWQNKGVAFLDFTKRGSCYGKMYLITKEQLVEIQHHEGPVWYNNKAQLGYEDGLPIYTLTHSPRWEQDTIPSEAYISVIKEGIRDCYPHLSNSGVDDYLLGCILKK